VSEQAAVQQLVAEPVDVGDEGGVSGGVFGVAEDR
jgi:hypothetical protein